MPPCPNLTEDDALARHTAYHVSDHPDYPVSKNFDPFVLSMAKKWGRRKKVETNNNQATPKNHNTVRMTRGTLVHLNIDDTMDRIDTNVFRPRIRHMQIRRMRTARVGHLNRLYDSIVRPGQQVRAEGQGW